MNKEQRERLREAAGKATPGDWRVEGEGRNPNMGCWSIDAATNVSEFCTFYDADFITLAQPRNTLALLDALDAAEAKAWPISIDGPTPISDQRMWLARQLMDSKMGDAEAFEVVAYHPDIKSARATAAEARVAVLEGLVVHLKESLADQASARHDPTMPLLTEEVLEALEGDAEAQYALADTREDRVNSQGLSLLCEWQRRALAAKLEGCG